MQAGARESPGRPLGWQPPGPSAVPGVVAAPPLPRRRLSRPAAPRLRHTKGRGTMNEEEEDEKGQESERRVGRRKWKEGTDRWKASIRWPLVPPVLKPIEQSTSTA